MRTGRIGGRSERSIDNRQQTLQWSPDGSAVYVTFQERGNIHLARLPLAGDSRRSWWVELERWVIIRLARDGSMAFTLATTTDLAELYLKDSGYAARQLTQLNAEVLAGKTDRRSRSRFSFVSNDNKYEVEAFLRSRWA